MNLRLDVCPKCAREAGLDDLTCQGCGALLRQQTLLGEILIDEGLISREKLEDALRLQKRRLGEILVEIGACRTEDLDRAVQLQRLGRTRAQIYRRWLRNALVLILFLAVSLSYALIRFEHQSHLQLRLEKEALAPAEVAEILADADSPHKETALRSLLHHPKDPRAAEVIKAALRHERWYVQLYAATLARDSGNRAFVGALIPLLVDETRVVAPVAHQALQALSGQTLPPSVKAWRAWAISQGLSLEQERPPGRVR